MKDFMLTDEFNNLSKEDKKEYLRKLIHSSDEAAEVYAAFYNPKTGESVTMMDLVKELGEEKTLDMMIEAFESNSMNHKAITFDDIKKLIEKDKKGLCSKEEKQLLKFIMNTTMSSSLDDNHLMFQNNMMDMIVNLIGYAQNNVKYNPTTNDIITSIAVLLISSGLVDKNSILYKYTNNNENIEIITEMCEQISSDIYDTWSKTCTTLPDDEILMLSLMHLACKISLKNNFKISNAIDIAADLGIKLDDVKEIIHQKENGSNKNENNDMRNLLKD